MHNKLGEHPGNYLLDIGISIYSHKFGRYSSPIDRSFVSIYTTHVIAYIAKNVYCPEAEWKVFFIYDYQLSACKKLLHE